MENHERAEKDYIMGMKYKEIAEKYGTTINTVKSWKKRYGWDRKKCAPKKEKVCTQNKVRVHDEPEEAADGTKDTIQNNELSPEQQMFCIYYSRTFNATQSYMKAYEGCAYSTALTNGPALLRKTQIKEEVARLKEIKRQQIVAGEEDIVELQMRIAFADIGEIVSCNGYAIRAKDFAEVDTQLIKKVKEGQNGLSIEMEDRQKAISWLTKYFLMHPDDKNRDEFERKRVEEFERKQKEFELKQEGNKNSSEELLKNIQTITDILQHPVSNRNITDFEGGDNE